jgi:hypothetical protein
MSARITTKLGKKIQYLGQNRQILLDHPPLKVTPFDAEFNSASNTAN